MNFLLFGLYTFTWLLIFALIIYLLWRTNVIQYFLTKILVSEIEDLNILEFLNEHRDEFKAVLKAKLSEGTTLEDAKGFFTDLIQECIEELEAENPGDPN